MKDFSTERAKQLAEQYGWSLTHAQGRVDGESSRRQGELPSKHAMVGIDEYSCGFRAGFFERRNLDARIDRADSPAPNVSRIGPAQVIDSAPVAVQEQATFALNLPIFSGKSMV